MCINFFFFKQKTAYEMRISDWSSDVCSSDLTAIVDIRKAAVPDVFEKMSRAASEIEQRYRRSRRLAHDVQHHSIPRLCIPRVRPVDAAVAVAEIGRAHV